jgi:hypothetical protein
MERTLYCHDYNILSYNIHHYTNSLYQHFLSKHGSMYKVPTLPTIGMLALISLAAAKGPAKLKVCMDFGGNGKCQEVIIGDSAFNPEQQFFSFPPLCTRTNGVIECPSSAQLLAGSDVRCFLGSNGIAAICSAGNEVGLNIVADGQ